MKNCEHKWICEDGKTDWCELCNAEQLHYERCENICEECCTHEDDVECGFCIDCGKYIGYRCLED